MFFLNDYCFYYVNYTNPKYQGLQNPSALYARSTIVKHASFIGKLVVFVFFLKA